MRAWIDITGVRFGKLVVLCFSHINKSGNACWNCQCDCGKVAIVSGRHLRRRNGGTRSCGCLHKEKAKDRRTALGLSRTRGYNVWYLMRRRCYKVFDKAFPCYGGRGIQVCARWFRLDNFIADMGQPPKNKSIDRINPNLHYMPSNCRWATWKEQAETKRNSLDLSGEMFGRWRVMRCVGTRGINRSWLCQCACGTISAVTTGDLRSARSKSCGCARARRKPYGGFQPGLVAMDELAPEWEDMKLNHTHARS